MPASTTDVDIQRQISPSHPTDANQLATVLPITAIASLHDSLEPKVKQGRPEAIQSRSKELN